LAQSSSSKVRGFETAKHGPLELKEAQEIASHCSAKL